MEQNVTMQMCGTSKCVDAIRALWALREIPGNYHGIECQLNIVEGVQYTKKKKKKKRRYNTKPSWGLRWREKKELQASSVANFLWEKEPSANITAIDSQPPGLGRRSLCTLLPFSCECVSAVALSLRSCSKPSSASTPKPTLHNP